MTGKEELDEEIDFLDVDPDLWESYFEVTEELSDSEFAALFGVIE